jgi:hypothetical protein
VDHEATVKEQSDREWQDAFDFDSLINFTEVLMRNNYLSPCLNTDAAFQKWQPYSIFGVLSCKSFIFIFIILALKSHHIQRNTLKLK